MDIHKPRSSFDEKSEAFEHIDCASSDNVESATRVATIDQIRVLGLSHDDEEFFLNVDAEERKKIIRKVDIRLIPFLALLYLASHIDRANIGNAKIEGLTTDLGLSGLQWNIVLAIFFVPYVLLEVPSNMLLKNFKRPSTYLGILVVSWGIIMTLTGIVRGFGGLMAVRVLLGVFEAGFFPGAVYLCTYWYMPRELQLRLALFYCASAISGAFSGLLAAAIAQMDGVGGYEGWRWIFILEGIVTVLLGFSCFFFLIDSPALSGKWLRPDEIRYLELRNFIKNGGKLAEERKRAGLHDFLSVITTWRIYLQAYILFAITACTYGLKFTLPTITKSLGFSSTNAQLLTAPPYICGAISALCFAWMSDHFYWRMPFVVIPLCLIWIAFAMIISVSQNISQHVGLAYFACCLSCIGTYPVNPGGSAWAANNFSNSGRRAIGVAFNLCVGNLGGILGSFMYLDSEKPVYHTGFGTSLALGASAAIVALILELSYWWANKQKEKMSEDQVRATYNEEELEKMGEKSPLFKYTL